MIKRIIYIPILLLVGFISFTTLVTMTLVLTIFEISVWVVSTKKNTRFTRWWRKYIADDK